MMSDEDQKFPWHSVDIEDVFERLETSSDGLNKAEAEERLKRTGPNTLEAKEGLSPIGLLVRQVNNPLIYLLSGAAILSLLVGHHVDAGVIAGVIVLNSLLGFIQEWRAEGALNALRRMSAPNARVLRGGSIVQIEATNVVPGDILVLERGDRVAAGARILRGEELYVDESALTGESQPVFKEPGQVDQDTPLADRHNMVWMSTSITNGRGQAAVVQTGMSTEMGRIAEEVRTTGREKTPLQERLHKLSILVGSAGVLLAALVFGLGLLRGYGLVEMLLFAVAVAVSAIPEGLPAVISVTLALGVRRMAERNAIIRRLPAVETLGSATVICSDKTGTITENQMTVEKLWAGGKTFEVTGEGYQPEGELRSLTGERLQELPNALELLLRIGLLCNNAELKEEEGRWKVDGNPSEGALLSVAIKSGLDTEKLRNEWTRLAEIPFSSDTKYMAVLLKRENGADRFAYVKGAPERILGFCSHVLIDGTIEELDDEFRREIQESNHEFADQALRVMAGGYREIGSDRDKMEKQDAEENLTLAGLWGMIDPPRKESIQAVEDAKKAGIHPVMITGDHALTALAIARQVGIARSGRARTGSDIEKMNKSETAGAAIDDGVFARVSPEHKLKIMESLKQQGHVVAMTGDGVNDAPALKGADIGVAMGRTGTEVAKEAADMVLTDDNFATIVHAVEEGRVIYSNLKRVVFFLLATNLGEILTLSVALILGFTLPLTAVMILWVNLVTDGACTVPLGVEPKHSNVLNRPPRNPEESVITRKMLLRMSMLTPIMAVGTLGLFWYAQNTGDLGYARTVAFTTLAAFQWFQAFNARSEFLSVFSIGAFTNKWIITGLGTAVLLQLAAVHTSVGQRLFGTQGLSWTDWIIILLVSSSIWIADELRKRFLHSK